MSISIEILTNSHIKDVFNSGSDLLDNYIKRQAKQDVRRKLSACYVLTQNDTKQVLGYYTLSSYSIPRNNFPKTIISSLPKSYDELPTVLLGRLAVDKQFKGNGYGELLLLDALNRSVAMSEHLGILAVIVDPLNTSVVEFYTRYGFILIPATQKMFLPIKTIKDIL
ncbi:MAG: GNAT family N-acetyltransferase [Paludibacter sp.]|jgi:ribosomal protein S18 acetylase RimI-like enzyme|nr:GNAT family N-acetyltransferase [Paludibacter sp.]